MNWKISNMRQGMKIAGLFLGSVLCIFYQQTAQGCVRVCDLTIQQQPTHSHSQRVLTTRTESPLQQYENEIQNKNRQNYF